MDGLTLPSGHRQVRQRSALVDVAGHVAPAGGMALLMLPALAEGHASLAGIGAMFALFLWAAVAGVCGRRRRSSPPGAVGDPFAMGLLMAVPYVALGLGDHTHGAVSVAPGGSAGASVVVVVLGLAVIAGWLLLRAGSARAQRAERFGFWWCLLMMAGMLLVMSASH